MYLVDSARTHKVTEEYISAVKAAVDAKKASPETTTKDEPPVGGNEGLPAPSAPQLVQDNVFFGSMARFMPMIPIHKSPSELQKESCASALATACSSNDPSELSELYDRLMKMEDGCIFGDRQLAMAQIKLRSLQPSDARLLLDLAFYIGNYSLSSYVVIEEKILWALKNCT